MVLTFEKIQRVKLISSVSCILQNRSINHEFPKIEDLEPFLTSAKKKSIWFVFQIVQRKKKPKRYTINHPDILTSWLRKISGDRPLLNLKAGYAFFTTNNNKFTQSLGTIKIQTDRLTGYR